MKWSQILHWLSAISGSIAIVLTIFAWSAGVDGTILSNGQMHWFIDAGIFLGIAIWLGTATILHQNIEQKNK